MICHTICKHPHIVLSQFCSNLGHFGRNGTTGSKVHTSLHRISNQPLFKQNGTGSHCGLWASCIKIHHMGFRSPTTCTCTCVVLYVLMIDYVCIPWILQLCKFICVILMQVLDNGLYMWILQILAVNLHVLSFLSRCWIMDYTWILWIMTIHLVDFSLTDCKFPRHKTERNLQQRIQPLVGKTLVYNWENVNN